MAWLLVPVLAGAEPYLDKVTVFQASAPGWSADGPVIVTVDASGGRFHVIAGGDTLHNWGESLHGTAFATDIDTADAYREIAIPEWGPSDDDAVHFVRLYADGPRLIGHVPGRWGDDLRVDGSGTIRTTCRGRVLHTWWYACEFRFFEEPGFICEVPQPFRVMNSEVTLKRDLPLWASPVHFRTTATIRSGERATIELTDDEDWCRIRSRSGVSGWFRVDGSMIPIDLERVPGHDVFDGLSFAD